MNPEADRKPAVTYKTHPADLIESIIRFDFARKAAAQPLRRAFGALALLAVIYATSNLTYLLVAHFNFAFDTNRVAINSPSDSIINITQSKIVLYDQRGYSWSLPVVLWSGQITSNDLRAFFDSWSPVLLAGWGAACFVWFGVTRVVIAFLFACLAWVLGCKFTDAFKVTLYAFTLPTLFGIVLQWLNAFYFVPAIWVGWAFIPYFAIMAVYFNGGLLMLPSRRSVATVHA